VQEENNKVLKQTVTLSASASQVKLGTLCVGLSDPRKQAFPSNCMETVMG